MNLVWKEFRESWPLVLMGFFVILFYALWPALSGDARNYGFGWGRSLYTAGTAILLFVATVLGVTSYAMEEEEGTLLPLIAKPIPTDDIMATKIGVRLGLLFVTALFFGGLQLITGAWPIEWNIPAPEIFLRWVGTVMVIILGFGLGLYFGRTRKEQTSGLMAALLVFLIGYAILNFTPLVAAFEGEDGPTRIAWIRGIALPGLVGVSIILLTIFMPPERSRIVSRPLAVLLALGVYAGIFWSLSLIPSEAIWIHPATLDEYMAVRFGSDEDAWDGYQRLVLPWDGEEDETGRIATWLINRTNVYWTEYEYGSDYDLAMLLEPYEDALEARLTVNSDQPVRYLTGGEEEYVLQERGRPWVGWVLAEAAGDQKPEYEKLLALHLAGAFNDSRLADSILPYLEDGQSARVRWMAGFMLLGLRDQRGRETLVELLPTLGSTVLNKYVYYLLDQQLRPTEEEVGRLFRDWIEEAYRWELSGADEGQELIRVRCRLADYWLKRHSTPADERHARMAEWFSQRHRVNSPETLADVDLWEWQMAWGRLDMEDWLYQDARHRLPMLREGLPRYRELRGSQRNYASWRAETREWRSAFSTSLNRYFSEVVELLKRGDLRAIELWKDGRELSPYSTRALTYYYNGDTALPHLPELGEPGLDFLRGLVQDPKVAAARRMQAALILVSRNEDWLTQDVFRFWDLYGDTNDTFWQTRVPATFLALIRQGHLQFISPILDEANRAERHGSRRWSRYTNGFGMREWNSAIPEILAKVTGQDFGWDLKAWTTWWEREGSKSSVGVNH